MLDLTIDVGKSSAMLRDLGDGIPAGLDEALQEIAELGQHLVQTRLDQVLRHPTGFYRSRIVAEPYGGLWSINDSGVIYGPWLEGVGRRNRTTRFKGYATFRKVSQDLARRAPLIAERAVMERVKVITR